jgi:hypothetical protein
MSSAGDRPGLDWGSTGLTEGEGMEGRAVKGCLVLGCAPPAALLLLFSFMLTMEQESMVGLRDNRSGIALNALALGVGAAAVALAAGAQAAKALRVTAFVVCGLLLVAGAFRAYTLAPMLKCESAAATAREKDGSYACYDRR